MPLGPANGGGGGKAGDVRAGGAYVEISAKDRLSAQLIGLQARARAFAASLAQAGRSIGLVGGLALAPLTALFKGGLNRADGVERMAEDLGVTIEQFQRLKFAADVAGVSVEEALSRPDRYAGLMAGATVLDAGTIREATQAQQQMRSALIDLQNAAAPLVSVFAPLVRAVATFAKVNGDWIRVAAVGAAGMTALGAATFVFGKALGLVSVVGRGVVVVVGQLLTKAGIIVGAIGGIAAAILTLTSSGRRLAGDLGSAFAVVSGTFRGMLKGITDAIKAGEFETAFKIFTTGIEEIWYEMIAGMAGAFAKFVTDNHNNLIAIGALMGGVEGGKLGRFFGPIGIAAGIAAGAAAGAAGGDQIAKLLATIGDTSALDAKAADAKKRLKELRDGIKSPAPNLDNEDMAKRITAVRGAFRKLSDANQQFGANDTLETTQKLALEQLRKANKNLDKLLDSLRLK